MKLRMGLAFAVIGAIVLAGRPLHAQPATTEPPPPSTTATTATPSAAVTPPTPEEDAQARVHFQSGQMFFGQGRYQEAALAFEEAFRLSHRPELLLNAATSYERMLQFEHALELSRRCVEELPVAHPRHGDCEIAVRRLTTMATQQRVEREASMQREADAHRAREEAERTAAAAEQRRAEAERAALTRDSSDGGLGGMQWAGVGAGAAGVGLGIWGAVTGYHARTARDALDTVCPTPSTCPDAATVQDTIDTMNRRARIATATTILAGAGLVTGVVLMIVGAGHDDDEADDDDDDAPRVTPTAGPGELGLGLSVRF